MQTSTKSTGKSDAAWNLLGSLIYAGCQWLVLVATVKFSSAADVGRLSLGFAVTAPIFLLLQLRLRAASATDAVLAYTERQYALLRVTCTAIAMAVTLALGLGLHLQHEELTIVLWIALAKAIESGSDLTYGLLQRKHNLRVVALSMAGRGILSVMAFCYLLRSTGKLTAALAGLCLAWGLIFVGVDVPFALRAASREKQALLRPASGIWRLAWVTLPLGLSTMFMSLSANMPRYFIHHLMGAAALGVFSASAYLTMTGSVIISAIAESSIARLAQSFARGHTGDAHRILRRVRSLTVVLSVALIAVSALCGKAVLTHLYRAEYAGSQWLLVVMMCAAGAANLASVYGYALIAARRFGSYLGCLVLSSITTALLCAVMVPRWSTMGAAVGCLAGYAVQFIVSRAMLASEFKPEEVPVPAALSFPPAASAVKF